MGVPVLNFEDFEAKFAQLKNKRKLFGFLLYDSRLTSQVVEKFTQERYNWLDELAGFGKIYFFIPLRKAAPKKFENPSLEVARFFNLDAGKLPGILLFTDFSPAEAHTNKAVYLELDKDLFADEANNVGEIENLFTSLFNIIRECQKDAKLPDVILEKVGERVEGLRRSQRVQPLIKYLKKGAKVLFIELPESILKAMAEGFGKALGERTAKN
jgi:hypothetical protein